MRFKIFLINLVPVLFTISTFAMVYLEIKNWGWFMFSAIFTHIYSLSNINQLHKNENKQQT